MDVKYARKMAKHSTKSTTLLPLISPEALAIKFAEQRFAAGEDAGENWLRATLLTYDEQLPVARARDFRTLLMAPMTPEQAIDLYRANSALVLKSINAATESAARRRLQFEGEDEVGERTERHPPSERRLREANERIATGQGSAQETIEKSMHYWGGMFELILELQKRVFALIREQMDVVPMLQGNKAAMAMIPDLSQMGRVVSALQGLMTSDRSPYETMQRVMADFARMGLAAPLQTRAEGSERSSNRRQRRAGAKG